MQARCLEMLRHDPTYIFRANKMKPDPWQKQVLRSTSSAILMLCSRQAGKSTVAGALALVTALLNNNSLILLLSRSLRQSSELFQDKVLRLYDGLGRPLQTTQESALRMALSNGSRIISLPGTERTVVGYCAAAGDR
jgi:hypothetical protein